MFVRRPERLIWAGRDFIKRFADGAFYPEEVQILVAAFDDAWSRLQSSHAPFAEAAPMFLCISTTSKPPP